MSEYYQFVLSTSSGKQRKLNVTNPDFSLANDSIRTAMTKIVAGDVFKQDTYGRLIGTKAGYKIVETKTVLM